MTKTQEERDKQHFDTVEQALIKMRKVVKNARESGLTVTFNIREVDVEELGSLERTRQEVYFYMNRRIL